MGNSQLSTPGPDLTPSVVAQQKRAIYMLSGVVILLLLGIGAWGLKNAGLFDARKAPQVENALVASSQQRGPSLMSSESSQNPSLLQSESTPSEQPLTMSSEPSQTPTMLQSQDSPLPPQLLASESSPSQTPLMAAETPVGMPADIRDWLEHLRITEGKREQMATQQVSEAVSMLFSMSGGNMGSLGGMLNGEDGEDLPRDPNGPNKVAQDANRMKADWNQLNRFFNSKKAPAECRSLQQTYNRVINETGNMITEIVSVVADVGDNPMGAVARLQGMVGKSNSRIDAVAGRADQGVADLCSKYNTEKWFSIKKDFGESAFGKLGL